MEGLVYYENDLKNFFLSDLLSYTVRRKEDQRQKSRTLQRKINGK